MADIVAALQRRQKSLVIASTIAVLTAVAALQIADLWWRREQTLAAAHTRARNLAFVLSEYVRGSFAVADTTLRQLAIHGRRVGGAEAAGPEWDPILASAKTVLPRSGSITVTDKIGTIRHSTIPIVGQSRRANYIFTRLSTSGRDELVVDRPFLTPTEPRRFLIPIGRPLFQPDGAFDGMVVATLTPEAYREFFRTMDVGLRGIVWVFHPDGVVLFREPSDVDPVGESATDNPVLLAAQRGAGPGVLEGPLVPGGAAFLSAYHTSGTPPLILGVSLDREEILADWYRQRRTSAIALGALTLTLGGIVAVLFRQIRARTRIEQELSEVQRLEAIRLREANERLEDALQREQRARRETEAASYMKDEFLMTVSHELRTPLTAIYGWVRMLSAGLVRPDERTKALAIVERNARSQTKLIDDLLDVSRAISGRLRLDARPIDVSDVMQTAVDTLRPALEAKSIRLEQQVESDLGLIVADADRLQQILWNLLSNAMKFTLHGGTICLSASRRGSSVEIAVTDNGVGIALEFLPHVFERFRQFEAGSRRRYGGLGLGLAIVRHLVELHGGTVTAESEGEGRGSTFRVVLPATAPIRTTPERQISASSAPTPRIDGRLDGVRVMVVDDETDACELFASVLGHAGATVVTASSAAEARRALTNHLPDVLVTDIEMAHEDGYQLLRGVRAEDSGDGKRVAAIAVTAYAHAIDRQRAIDAGFDWYLAKPIEPGELVSVILSLVHTRTGQVSH